MIDWKNLLGDIKAVLTAILAVLTTIAAILQLLKPALLIVLLAATVVVPNGGIIWFLMYKAAQNSDRIGEPAVFLSLVAQSTIVISIYTVVWGTLLYPKYPSQLRPYFMKQSQTTPQPSDGGQDQPAGEPSSQNHDAQQPTGND